MSRVFRDSDADLTRLSGKRIAVLGYGSQGKAQALNLRDSGFEPVIGVRRGNSWDRAASEGFQVREIAEVADADILVFCLPDIEAGSVFKNEIASSLQRSSTLVFAHGFAVHFGLIEPPEDVSAVLVAPMGAGPVVRSSYEQGSGVPALLGVHGVASKEDWELSKAYGSAIGSGRAAMLESSFEEETVSDLFGEQAVLCGGLPELMRGAFKTMVEGGIQPEVAYIASVHEVKLIVDLIYQKGLDGMVQNISRTAEWGAYETGPKVIAPEARVALSSAFDRIQRGEFARDWIGEMGSGGQTLRSRHQKFLDDPIHEVGHNVRRMMGMESFP